MDDSVYEQGYPEGAILRLQEAVNVVAPSLPISIGRWDDRSTWGYHAEQSDEIDAIFAAFDPWAGTGGIAGPESMVYEGSPLDADDESPDEVGASEFAIDDAGDSGLDGEDASGDYLEEEALDSPPDEPASGDIPDELSPANSGGVLIRELGDALSTAKAEALMKIDDQRFARVGEYDEEANEHRLNMLRSAQQALLQGLDPALDPPYDAEEQQALETFVPLMRTIERYAQDLRNAVRQAESVEAVEAIDIISGWPE